MQCNFLYCCSTNLINNFSTQRTKFLFFWPLIIKRSYMRKTVATAIILIKVVSQEFSINIFTAAILAFFFFIKIWFILLALRPTMEFYGWKIYFALSYSILCGIFPFIADDFLPFVVRGISFNMTWTYRKFN